MEVNNGLRKVIRYIFIYGLFRTLTKVFGRVRPRFKFWLILKFPFYSTSGKKVGLIGCGHHAFTSIAYYLSTSTNAKIVFSLDLNPKASSSLAYAYNALDIGATCQKSDTNNVDIVYISSNHASHTQYAVYFLEQDCDVFIEKPIAINKEQLDLLSNAVKKSNKKVYVGYNRPHSPSIKIIKDSFIDNKTPFTLACFVSGHLIPKDHWYRDPSEGTRIVSNLGHWIDLSIYILSWSNALPEFLDVTISYSDLQMPSDNIGVSIISSNHDLINITFTSRGEPFEGVREMINFQKDDVSVQIDDYRSTKIWKGSHFQKYSHWPKNNGHKSTVLQPFSNTLIREWDEIELSTRLMLHIEEMVKSNTIKQRFEVKR